MTDLVVEVYADPRWVSVPLDTDTDVDAWAAAEVAAAFEAREHTPAEHEVDLATAVFAGLARTVQRTAEPDQPIEAAFALLAAQQDVYPVTVATARRLAAAELTTDQAISALVAPQDVRYDEPEVDEVDTPAGAAYRVVQRLMVPAEDGTSTVQEWHAYLWHLEDVEAAVVLSVQFADLIDAAVFDEAVRALAAGVRITR